MKTLQPRYNKNEFAQKGQILFEREVRPHVTESDSGKFVAIDIETGFYEVDADDYVATQRLLQHQPNAQIWLCRVGQKATYKKSPADRF